MTTRPGPEDDPSFSPDGRQLVYRDSRRGYNVNDELYIVTAKSGRTRNLTQSLGDDWGPAWSPDGRFIAFSSSLQLTLIRPDGLGRRSVTNIEAEYPAWSPDSHRIAFMSSQPGAHGPFPDYDIYVIDVDGRHRKRLIRRDGEDGWPSWSPSGKWIAYTARTRDSAELRLIRPNGTGDHLVFSGAAADYPAWAPDGGWILFTGRFRGHERLYVIRPDGTDRTPLPLYGTLADWSSAR